MNSVHDALIARLKQESKSETGWLHLEAVAALVAEEARADQAEQLLAAMGKKATHELFELTRETARSAWTVADLARSERDALAQIIDRFRRLRDVPGNHLSPWAKDSIDVILSAAPTAMDA